MIDHRLAYFIGLLSSLSAAGSSMTLLALSASLFVEDNDGIASSYIQLIMYLGVATVGIFGGGLLQRISAPIIGIFGPLASALLVLLLAYYSHVPIEMGLAASFLIFLLGGIDHPNNLRFLNMVLKEDQKIAFFSRLEVFSYLLTVTTPLIAAWLISKYGPRTCFVVDTITYVISALPWFLVQRLKSVDDRSSQNKNWFVGFRELWSNANLRYLTTGRLLNNLAYVSWAVSLPLVVASIAGHDVGLFANNQGLANAMLSIGSITLGIVGSFFLKGRSSIPTMVFLSSIMGFLSVGMLFMGYQIQILICLSGFILGAGQYCFRLTGMILGQANTPKHLLGSVIIAGDTIVRFWSFIISFIVIFLFQRDIRGAILILSSFALVTPMLTLFLAKVYQKADTNIAG